jgi:hypothetical protein
MSKFTSFQEYMSAKGKVVAKPKIEEVPDYPGPQGKTDDCAKKNKKKFPQLKEYIDAKGKLCEKPATEIVADYDGPDAKAPKDGKPYKAPGDAPKQSAEAGLADKGDKSLVYEPDTDTGKKSDGSKNIPGGKLITTKSEAFLNKTKDMPLREFTEHMIQECSCGTDELPTVTAYTAGKYHPYPPEVIKYVVALANKNESVLNSLVNEIKKSGGLGNVLEAFLNHPESYGEISDLFEDSENGARRCKYMARALNDRYTSFLEEQSKLYETVGPPIGLGHEDDLEDDEDEDDTDPDAEEGEGDEDDLDAPQIMGDGSEDEEGDEDMGDEDADMGDDLDGNDPGAEGMPMPPKKINKRFAHDNVIEAMIYHGALRETMKKYLV